MCQSNNCCQDYSLKTANTGLGTIKTANTNLDGSGNLINILTANANGAVIKSVIIKATEPVTTGMVRLFIQKPATQAVLYKEVQIPITPVLDNTPIPAPILSMFEIKLKGDIQLESGSSLVATTQIKNSFNLIVDAYNWDYPATLPSDCCNFRQVVAITGTGVVNTANPNLDGTGSSTTIFTAPSSASSNGTHVNSLTIKALQSTSINGMIRLFIYDGSNSFLMQEIRIPETQQSAFTPSYKQIVELDMNLAPGFSIVATTQNSEAFGLTIDGESWSYPI